MWWRCRKAVPLSTPVYNPATGEQLWAGPLGDAGAEVVHLAGAGGQVVLRDAAAVEGLGDHRICLPSGR